MFLPTGIGANLLFLHDIELSNRSGLRFLMMIATTPGLLHRALHTIFGSEESGSTDIDEPCNVALLEMAVIIADRFMQSYEYGGPFAIKRRERMDCETVYEHQTKPMRIGSLMFTCSKGGGLLFRAWNLSGQD